MTSNNATPSSSPESDRNPPVNHHVCAGCGAHEVLSTEEVIELLQEMAAEFQGKLSHCLRELEKHGGQIDYEHSLLTVMQYLKEVDVRFLSRVLPDDNRLMDARDALADQGFTGEMDLGDRTLISLTLAGMMEYEERVNPDGIPDEDEDCPDAE